MLTPQQREEIKQKFREQKKAQFTSSGFSEDFLRERIRAAKSRQAEQPTRAAQPEDEKGILKFGEKAGEVMSGIWKGIGSTVRGASSIGEKILQAPLKAVGVDFDKETSAEQIIPEELVTPETTAEKIGFGAEQIAEFFVPWTKVSKLPTASIKLRGIPKLVEEAGDFALRSGVQKGKIEGKDFGAGLALGGAFRVGSKLFKAATEALPKRLVQNVLKQSKKEIKSGKDVSEFILENKRVGSAESLFDKSVSEIDTLSNKIQKNLNRVDYRNVIIDRNKIYQELQKDFAESGLGLKELDSIIKKLSPQAMSLLKKSKLSLTEANRLRQLIDKTLGDRAFLGAQLPFEKEILKSFNTSLRNSVKQKAPQGTKGLFDTLSKEITVRNALDKVISSGKGNRVLGLTDFLTIGGAGATLGAPGAIALTAAKKIAETPQAKTATAMTLRNIKKLESFSRYLPQTIKGSFSQILKELQEERNTD